VFTVDWFRAAGIRAIKTFAQTLIGMIAVGAAFEDVVWVKILSVAGVATILSLLMSLAGLPEVGSDGTLVIDTKNPAKDVYSLELDKSLETLPTKKVVKFKVKK
jgi:hypothetical protein